MTLAGGDPDMMSLPRFLDVSYALLAEEHQRINPLKDLLQISDELAPAAPRSSAPQVRTTVATQNKQSMSMIQGMLASVPNAPNKRTPRRTK